MRKAVPAAGLVLIALSAEAQIVTEMTPERVKEAQADERSEGCYSFKVASLPATRGDPRWTLPNACFTTPYSRVVLRIRKARQQYTPFDGTISPEDLAPELHINTYARLNADARLPASVAMVVLMPFGETDRSKAIRPERTEDEAVKARNRMGAEFEVKNLKAVFPLSMLSDDYEVRVVYGDGSEGRLEFELSKRVLK